MSTNTTNQYNPDHSILSLFPYPYLMPHHLTDNGRTEVSLLISDIRPQVIEVEPGSHQERPVIHFEKTELGFILNSQFDVETLANIYAIHSIGQATGKTITIAIEQGQLIIVPPSNKKAAKQPIAKKASPKSNGNTTNTTGDTSAAAPMATNGTEPEPAVT